jgi:hypothetical protein
MTFFSSLKPEECPKGYYCLRGVATRVEVVVAPATTEPSGASGGSDTTASEED